MRTRFRPTPTGDLHLGHALLAAMNYTRAHHAGDEFLLIVDDLNAWNQGVPYWAGRPESWAPRYVEDLEWLGIGPDRTVLSLENTVRQEEALAQLGLKRAVPDWPFGALVHVIQGLRFNPPPGGPAYDGPGGRLGGLGEYAGAEYSPAYIAAKVADDAHWGVEAFFQGLDLRHELTLYDYLCRELGFRSPYQTHMPLVRREHSLQQSTAEGTSIRQLREAGYDPREVLYTLYQCMVRSGAIGQECTIIPRGVLEIEGAKRTLPWHEDEMWRSAFGPVREIAPGEPQATAFTEDHPFLAEIRELCATQYTRIRGDDEVPERGLSGRWRRWTRERAET